MLISNIVDKLHEQLNLEFFSSNLYLQMSGWCSINGFDGASSFLRKHSSEEMMHMSKMFDYLADNNEMPIIGTIIKPQTDFDSMEKLLRKAYEHEKIITKKINDLSNIAIKSEDYTTFHFLQWYVFEQQEEEKLFQSVLNKLDLARSNDNNGVGIFLLDKELMEMSKLK